jgi:hypothetical protein
MTTFADGRLSELSVRYAKHRIALILGLVFLLSAYVSCSKAPSRAEHGPKQTNEAITKASPIQSPTHDAAICTRIPDIKLYPFHGERGKDAAYDAFMDAGEAAVPCLINKTTDTTNIPDPSESFKFPETTVGDLAYFLLIDITKLGFVELMPREVQTDYKNNGVWAYYAYVAKRGHRKDLQKKLYEWYRTKYGKDASIHPD